jgi:hypothetical protein
MANIFRVYKDSQVTTDRIRAENAAQSIVTPDRVVYVFGTADGTAPNFSTVSSALTYANSLTPTLASPVHITAFLDASGAPYVFDLYALQLQGIYVSSPFDPWARYVLYGGVLTEQDMYFTIDESQLAITVQG